MLSAFVHFSAGSIKPHSFPPELYLCEKCGYVGRDLSKQPTPEEHAILKSKKYRMLFESFCHDYGLIFLLGGFLASKLGNYEEAAYYYCRALDFGIVLKVPSLEDQFMTYLMDNKGFDMDYVISQFNVDYTICPSFLRELIFECGERFGFVMEGPALLQCHLVDAYRRNAHFEAAKKTLDACGGIECEETERCLLEQERDLCEKEDGVTALPLLSFF